MRDDMDSTHRRADCTHARRGHSGRPPPFSKTSELPLLDPDKCIHLFLCCELHIVRTPRECFYIIIWGGNILGGSMPAIKQIWCSVRCAACRFWCAACGVLRATAPHATPGTVQHNTKWHRQENKTYLSRKDSYAFFALQGIFKSCQPTKS